MIELLEADHRVRGLNRATPPEGARYVLYWAQANRRVDFNQALLAAARLANELDLPLLYFEQLSFSDRCANDRLLTFVLEGVPETARRLARSGAGYVFYLRRGPSDPDDVLFRLAEQAAALITDDFPAGEVPARSAAAAARLPIPCLAVDASCTVPMNLIPERQYAAFSIRPKLQRLLPRFLKPLPALELRRPWRFPPSPYHTEVIPERIPQLVASCRIDHSVPPSRLFRGGSGEAEKRLAFFLARNLARYARYRNDPAARATSNLSPYLHFGQISALEVALAAKTWAEEHRLIADEFLEELIVRRELAFNFCRHAAHPDRLEELPEWARRTLRRHAADPRPALYTPEQFLRAETHDQLWNAAQKELLLTGKIHGYYRMYWGKKIIEWSSGYEEALRTMIELHERYALDGRDPNTYANILWCFGLHDRPWRERPVLGTLRYLSREGMERKSDVPAYLRWVAQLERAGAAPEPVE